MNRVLRTLRQFLWEPIAKKSGALFLLQITQLLHDRTDGACDESLRRVIALARPPQPLPSSHFLSNTEIDDAVGMIRTHGWTTLPRLFPQDDISALINLAFSTSAYAGTYATREMVDVSSHHHARYEWPIAELLKATAIQKLIEDSALHRIAQEYLGCLPILTSISMWLDGVYNGIYDAHVYHYDNDGPRFLKFFIYLTDVDNQTGAHSFIQGSHGRRKPHQFGRAKRYDRDELLNHYGQQNEIIFAAPAGTIIAEDTSGFHRGIPPQKGYRLLVQLEYSAVDIPHAEEFTVGIPKIQIHGIDPAVARIARKFVR